MAEIATSTTERSPKLTPGGSGKGSRGRGRGGLLARASLYYREVIAELRKVIWPNRKELVTYTVVVLVFVSFMIAVVFGLDTAFSRAVLAVFG